MSTPKLKSLEQLVDFCSLHDIELVSYGLAPNPNGFCYEVGDSTCAADCDILDSWLDGLTSKQELELRQLVFGLETV